MRIRRLEIEACNVCLLREIRSIRYLTKILRDRYDMASLEILDRINYVASLLENRCDPPTVQKTIPQQVDLAHMSHGLDLHLSPGYKPWSEVYNSDTRTGQDEAEILLESLEIAGRTPQVSEDVLNWPIFGENFDRSEIESLIFNPQNYEHTESASHSFSVVNDQVRSLRPGKGICEEDILSLIDRFLINVHIKNPVLDADDLIDKARKISENGFSWDSYSCLVVCFLISSKILPETNSQSS